MEVSRRTAIKVAGAGAVGIATSQVFGATDADAASLGSVRIPKLKLNKVIYAGTTNKTLNKGGFGHWIGSAKPGTVGHSVLFAHRTSAGGPLRKANKLNVGDKIVAAGVTYTVTGREIIGKKESRRALNYGSTGKRLSLITCTKKDGTPTSTAYRLIIRATA